MIEVFKIVHGKYESELGVKFNYNHSDRTRGNKFKLVKDWFKYDLRKFYFTNRIIDVWNSLPDYVVDVDTVDLFKSRLDNFWNAQDVVFDYKSEITGIGSRSNYEIVKRLI
jgi:hypothetical protein